MTPAFCWIVGRVGSPDQRPPDRSPAAVDGRDGPLCDLALDRWVVSNR
jgi:hypothetical protein